MRTDRTLGFRVIYAPRRTFEEMHRTNHPEVLIPVMLIAILTTTRAYLALPQRELVGLGTLLVTFLYGTIAMLTLPLVLTTYVFLLWQRLGTRDLGFWRLFLAFVLSAFPSYIGAVLGTHSQGLYVGLGDLLRLSDAQPFLYGVLETVTPFSLWTVGLWWIAITMFFRPSSDQRIVLVGSLFLLEMLINGVQRSAWAEAAFSVMQGYGH